MSIHFCSQDGPFSPLNNEQMVAIGWGLSTNQKRGLYSHYIGVPYIGCIFQLVATTSRLLYIRDEILPTYIKLHTGNLTNHSIFNHTGV